MAGKGILFSVDGDLHTYNKTLVIGESTMQEVAVIFQMNQGEQKFFPALGANLIQLIGSKASRLDIENRAKVHLALDGKSWDLIKSQIHITIKK